MAEEVVIVGAGPSGLAAAIELKRLGIESVTVIEREREAGGIPRHSDHTGFGARDLRRVMSGPRYARRYRELADEADVEVIAETMVTDWQGEAHALAHRPVRAPPNPAGRRPAGDRLPRATALGAACPGHARARGDDHQHLAAARLSARKAGSSASAR